jgi:hypothetical protein
MVRSMVLVLSPHSGSLNQTGALVSTGSLGFDGAIILGGSLCSGDAISWCGSLKLLWCGGGLEGPVALRATLIAPLAVSHCAL